MAAGRHPSLYQAMRAHGEEHVYSEDAVGVLLLSHRPHVTRAALANGCLGVFAFAAAAHLLTSGRGGRTSVRSLGHVVSAQEVQERSLEIPLGQGSTTLTTASATTVSTASATTASSTTSTTTTTIEFLEPVVEPGPTMYCFMVARMTGDEGDLVKCQFRRGASIFGCNDFNVFSDSDFVFTYGPPEVQTYIMRTGISTQGSVAGSETAGYLNTEVFLRAWQEALGMPKVLKHQWVVKVDPDTVFFPNRLRSSLVAYGDEPVYLRNCPGGPRGLEFFGSLEVVSMAALAVFSRDWMRCVESFGQTSLGEDFFLQKCMDLLEVKFEFNAAMLADAYCLSQAVDCRANVPALHPFKVVDAYFRCWEESGGPTVEPKPGLPPRDTCAAPPWPAGLEPAGVPGGLRPPPPEDQPEQPEALEPPPPILPAPEPSRS